MPEARIAFVGGSGLYEIEGFEGIQETTLSTPFGSPSDAYVTGTLGGVKLAFLPRHGRGHRISPSEINFRANIWGMKKLGVTLSPGDLMLPTLGQFAALCEAKLGGEPSGAPPRAEAAVAPGARLTPFYFGRSLFGCLHELTQHRIADLLAHGLQCPIHGINTDSGIRRSLALLFLNIGKRALMTIQSLIGS